MKRVTAAGTETPVVAQTGSGRPPPPSDGDGGDGGLASRRCFSDLLRRSGVGRQGDPARRFRSCEEIVIAPGAASGGGPAGGRAVIAASRAAGGGAPVVMPEIALRDVSVASGPQDTRLAITIDEGSLAGLRVAFLLRGAALDVSWSAPTAEIGEAVLSREDDVREALSSKGIDVARFDLEDGGRQSSSDEVPDAAPPRPAQPSRTAGTEPAATGGTTRDYVR